MKIFDWVMSKCDGHHREHMRIDAHINRLIIAIEHMQSYLNRMVLDKERKKVIK